MKILGISAFYHDSAATIIENGQIIAAAQEERFTRKKHDPSFPTQAIKFCLNYSGFNLEELDAIAFYDKPLLKFERLIETYYAFSPKGLLSFLNSIPTWAKEKLFLKKIIRDELTKIHGGKLKSLKLLFPEHHLSHAASTFYPSPFKNAAILTIDGVGEWATASISIGENEKITIKKELHFPHSLGLLYSAFTYFLGFKVNSGEYKLMGLAPYGNPTSEAVKKYIKSIKTNLVTIKEDGSIKLNQKLFSYPTSLKMIPHKKWEQLFKIKKRKPESPLEQKHCDLALAIQKVTEEVVIKIAKEAKKITNCDHLCLAGGVALNCVANGKLLKEKIFKEIYIQPAAGDAGGSLGAALAAHHIYFNQPRSPQSSDSMQGAYLGPEFSDLDIKLIAKKFKAPYQEFSNFEKLCQKTAKLISQGKIIGWFQDRMEFGPRALGNRSILGDPRNPEMQKKLNLQIKYRESFRPFAPSVLSEKSPEYFDITSDSPYMLLVAEIKKTHHKTLPENYHSLPLKDKLYTLRSDIPAITHIDLSARIQTVHKETNPKYWQLINEFNTQTNCPLLINTSFNVRGEPIVCTPEDAYNCFTNTEMDYLVMNNFLFEKEKQPKASPRLKTKQNFALD